MVQGRKRRFSGAGSDFSGIGKAARRELGSGFVPRLFRASIIRPRLLRVSIQETAEITFWEVMGASRA